MLLAVYHRVILQVLAHHMMPFRGLVIDLDYSLSAPLVQFAVLADAKILFYCNYFYHFLVPFAVYIFVNIHSEYTTIFWHYTRCYYLLHGCLWVFAKKKSFYIHITSFISLLHGHYYTRCAYLLHGCLWVFAKKFHCTYISPVLFHY